MKHLRKRIRPATQAAGVLVILLVSMACAPASTLSLEELTHEYSARFHATEDILILVVENVPGLNLASVQPVIKEGRVVLVGQRISSGGGGTLTLCVDLSAYNLGSEWSSHVWWAEPDAALVRVTEIVTGEEALPNRRLKLPVDPVTPLAYAMGAPVPPAA